MMSFLSALTGVALLLVEATAHMQLYFPAPFNATNNQHRSTPQDPYLTFPYNCCGEYARWQYPCRGYQNLLGTPEGAPTAKWTAGTVANWSVTGEYSTIVPGGTHSGGSCQVGFSVDGGNKFRVATSYEGDCPRRAGNTSPGSQNFNFTVPYDIPQGVHIFAWMWYNREHELNMNCAAVNIVSDPTSVSGPTSSNISSALAAPTSTSTSVYGSSTSTPVGGGVAFNDRPFMFVADDGNGCDTPRTTVELKYPDPGPEVVHGDGLFRLDLPLGGCSPEQQVAKQQYNGETGNDGHIGP